MYAMSLSTQGKTGFHIFIPAQIDLRGAIRRNIFSGRAIGAVVAQQLYTLWVGGSNPSSPTKSPF
jgi:hypothetical protein